MATILRAWSYRYQWLYDAIARLAALGVGGEARFRQLALEGLTIQPETQVLDLCCGSGQATQYLVERSHHVTGLDASPRAIERARHNVPEATYVEGWAEQLPFQDEQFDIVHTSVALHEMAPQQLQQILKEIYRVLKPGGVFTFVDFHAPTNPLFWPGLALFLWLFETETAWRLIQTDIAELLKEIGFQPPPSEPIPDPTIAQPPTAHLFAGGSFQVVHAYKGQSSLQAPISPQPADA